MLRKYSIPMALVMMGILVVAGGCKKKSSDSGGGVPAPVPAPQPANPDTYKLTISKDGNGSGRVISSPAGITCGNTCDGEFTSGTSLTLTAEATSARFRFVEWGGNCTGSGNCVISMDGDKNVTATFVSVEDPRFTITLEKDGDGDGTVTSTPAGIDCGSDCSENFKENTSVVLSATPADAFSEFSGWVGPCSGTGDCAFSVDQTQNLTATFMLVSFPLTVSKIGDGDGSVIATSPGIDCGTDCEESLKAHTTVTLNATPLDDTHEFRGWTGDCNGMDPCSLTMDGARNVTAEFALKRFDLLVNKTGNGTGIISSNPPGIDCGTDCSESVAANETVALSYAQETGYFLGWSGSCAGRTPCEVLMDDNKNVTAEFGQVSVDGFYFGEMPSGYIVGLNVEFNNVTHFAYSADNGITITHLYFYSNHSIADRVFNLTNGSHNISGEFLSAYDIEGNFSDSEGPDFSWRVERDMPAASAGVRSMATTTIPSLFIHKFKNNLP